jgi:hypothetical protein
MGKLMTKDAGGIEQFNGREAKTATLYDGSSFSSRCAWPVFAHVISSVRHLLST